MTVYVDVLLAINFFVNYLLLSCVRHIKKRDVKTVNLILSASAGALYSLIILFPSVPRYIQLPLNFAVMSLMVCIGFLPKQLKSFIKLFLTFAAVNFAFAGIMFAIWFFISPSGMIYSNGAVYYDIDIKLLIALCLVCYAVVRVTDKIARRTAPDGRIVSVVFTHCSKSITVNALEDTGNSLRDCFSGEPVIIADERTVVFLLGHSLYDAVDGTYAGGEKIRMIPVNTVSGGGLLAAFRVNEISTEGKSFENVLVAQSRNKILTDEYSVILNNRFFS